MSFDVLITLKVLFDEVSFDILTLCPFNHSIEQTYYSNCQFSPIVVSLSTSA
jgi:hypothetical protein